METPEEIKSSPTRDASNDSGPRNPSREKPAGQQPDSEEFEAQHVALKEPDPDDFPDGGFRAWLCIAGGFCTVFSSFGWVNCKTMTLFPPFCGWPRTALTKRSQQVSEFSKITTRPTNLRPTRPVLLHGSQQPSPSCCSSWQVTSTCNVHVPFANAVYHRARYQARWPTTMARDGHCCLDHSSTSTA